MEEDPDNVNGDRFIFEGKPPFSVFHVELGHLPFINIRFERQEDDSEGLDLYVTVGGGAPLTTETTAEFLREVADMLDESEDMDEAPAEPWEKPDTLF